MSYIICFNEDMKGIGVYNRPLDMEINCYQVNVFARELCEMKLRGKCDIMNFRRLINKYNDMDWSGCMDLKIGMMIVHVDDWGLLKLLELNCKEISCIDEKLEKIMNKYLKEEDPLMRDIQGCKYELAVNGYGDRL